MNRTRTRTNGEDGTGSGAAGGLGTRRKEEHPGRPKVCVLGLGQMGLVCAGVLAGPGDDSEVGPPKLPKSKGAKGSVTPAAGPGRPVNVTMWGRAADEGGVLAQTRQSPRLPGFLLPESVRIALKPAEALKGADVIVSAIPVQYIRGVWGRMAKHVPAGAGVVSVAKGIENVTLLRPTQVIADVLRKTGADDPDQPARPLACLSGPTIAPELARCMPAAMIAASDDADFAKRVQALFNTSWLRIYTNPDLLGVELAGAMKNVIAIAAGIVDGLQAGYNAKSALLARGLAEITRLGVAMGATADTFFGVAGVGDLATTCFSPEGRNRALGEAIGRGTDISAYLDQSESVIEGVATTRSVAALAKKYRVEMPICTAVHAVLFEEMDPIEAIGRLMSRAPKPERVG